MTAIFDMMDKFEVFRSLNMIITLADVHTEDDCKKLTNDIHAKLKQKIIQRLFHATAYTAATCAVLVGSLKLCSKISVNNKKSFVELFALAMAPVLLVLCRLVYTIAKGIIMVCKGNFRFGYAQTVARKVQEHFAERSSFDFLISLNPSCINLKKDLNFGNGVTGCRSHDVLVSKFPSVINKIVEVIREHGIASSEAYCNYSGNRAISKNDPDWKVIRKQAEIKAYGKMYEIGDEIE
ncbi:MAG: hypothetical protein H0W88_05160 [Parachlamydiaceae bacterium]|nr:hypothetical protein [Parachlamydiaceae bacterium]